MGEGKCRADHPARARLRGCARVKLEGGCGSTSAHHFHIAQRNTLRAKSTARRNFGCKTDGQTLDRAAGRAARGIGALAGREDPPRNPLPVTLHETHKARDVDQLNAGLANYERIGKFAILPNDLTLEAGELTPSMKVRRRVVEERYKPLLDALYAER